MSVRARAGEKPGRPAPWRRRSGRSVPVSNPCFDSKDLVVTDYNATMEGLAEKVCEGEWGGEPIFFDLRLDAESAAFGLGFYEPEEFGSWSRIDSPWIVLPVKVQGVITARLTVRGYGASIGREVTVRIGSCERSFELPGPPTVVVLLFDVDEPTQEIHFSGLVAESMEDADDPRTLALGLTSVELRRLSGGLDVWEGLSAELSLVAEEGRRLWGEGFYYLEEWGAWSQASSVSLILPFSVRGALDIELDLIGHGATVGRTLEVVLGDSTGEFVLPPGEGTIRLSLAPRESTGILTINGLVAQPTPGQEDQRTLALGMRGVRLSRSTAVEGRRRQRYRRPKPSKKATASRRRLGETSVSGMVFTMFLEPEDRRVTDWRTVMSAFCWAFKEQPRATLLILVPNQGVASIFAEYMHMLYRVGGMECRVVLSIDDGAGRLSAKTLNNCDFGIILRRGERQDELLSRYLSAGVPVVASVDPGFADRFGGAVVAARPLRVPVRRIGSLTRMSTEMREEVDWDRIARALQQCFAAHEEGEPYRELARVARSHGGRS